MIPNVFVSSTIQDLQYLRDAIRETLIELGYNPVMSDYGDIGYLPTTTAEESCYVTIRDCQLAVLIIGKRYGSVSRTGLSVTHNEFHTARENSIPVVSLVDRDVMSFKVVYDANQSSHRETTFPGMDSPTSTFRFIQEIGESKTNNGVLAFSSAAEVRQQVKKQIAHLFGEMLRNRFDPIKVQLQDVLAEVKTLRYELLKDKGPEPTRYLKAMRFFLEDDRLNQNDYRQLARVLVGTLEDAIPIAIESGSFEEFVHKTNKEIEVLERIPSSFEDAHEDDIILMTSKGEREPDEDGTGGEEGMEWAVLPDKVVMDRPAKRFFDDMHTSLIQATRS